MLDACYDQAAAALATADALLIGAGAGMGVDSGLPDFRGPEGFWKAYPPFRGLRFQQVSTPHWFRTDPCLAWGFFGHRWKLYRDTVPHEGFAILRRWSERLPCGSFVFTSNVDGQFQKAGFPHGRIVECHGSIHHQQCQRPCRDSVWEAGPLELAVDPDTIRAAPPLPTCPHCGEVARPNILMFGDATWIEHRTGTQWQQFQSWLRSTASARLVTIELGAGVAVPSVRLECESQRGLLIRINPLDADTPTGGISLPVGALTALRAIDERLANGRV